MITSELLNRLKQQHQNHSVTNAVGGSILADIADPSRLLHQVPEYTGKEHPSFEQGKTGYCWLSALLFCLYRYGEKSSPTDGKLLSKSYLIFYDKLEKANNFLELLLERLDEPQSDRTVNYLLKHAMTDQGQWEMGINLIRKYGVVPYDAMPDVSATVSNGELNACLALILRCTAVKLRSIHEARQGGAALQAEKWECLQRVYHILVDFYGTPPSRVGTLTPIQYFEQQVAFPFENYISICCTGQPPFINYTVELDGNVVEGKRNTFFSVPDVNFEEAMARQVKEEGFCWFSCDIGKFYLKNHRLLDDSIFDFDQVMEGENYTDLTREELFQTHIASMTHAMVLCDRLIRDGKLYWIAKNSVAGQAKRKSYCAISENWFRRYAFQAIVKREFLPANAAKKGNAVKEVMPWEFFDGEA